MKLPWERATCLRRPRPAQQPAPHPLLAGFRAHRCPRRARRRQQAENEYTEKEKQVAAKLEEDRKKLDADLNAALAAKASYLTALPRLLVRARTRARALPTLSRAHAPCFPSSPRTRRLRI